MLLVSVFSLVNNITRHKITIETSYLSLKIGADHNCGPTCFIEYFGVKHPCK